METWLSVEEDEITLNIICLGQVQKNTHTENIPQGKLKRSSCVRNCYDWPSCKEKIRLLWSRSQIIRYDDVIREGHTTKYMSTIGCCTEFRVRKTNRASSIRRICNRRWIRQCGAFICGCLISFLHNTKSITHNTDVFLLQRVNVSLASLSVV